MAAIQKRRKKSLPAEETLPVADVVEESPGAPSTTRVSLSDLWEMRLAQADKRTAEAQAEAARMSRLYLLAKIDPKGLVLAVEKKIDDAKKAIESAENRALIAKKRMEFNLGRPLTGLAIDPDSGEVQIPKE